MNKNELINALTEKGIEHDPNATNKDLEALLNSGSEMEAPVETQLEPDNEPVAEEPKGLDKNAKNFAAPKMHDPKGNPDVEVKLGQVKKIVDAAELAELQKNNKLVGYNPATKEAVSLR